jgi:DNA-binding response OmpR family regulator
MTTGILSKDEGVASSAGGAAALRIAVLDRDSGFIQVLSKRMDRLGWEHRVLASPVPTDAIASMRLSALVVDLTVLGPQAWEWLERLCGTLPELGIVVCTGPSTVAQRVRGLRLGADDWITKPCHPEEVMRACRGLYGAAAALPPVQSQSRFRRERWRFAPTDSRRSWPAARWS